MDRKVKQVTLAASGIIHQDELASLMMAPPTIPSSIYAPRIVRCEYCNMFCNEKDLRCNHCLAALPLDKKNDVWRATGGSVKAN